jgi:hypothetical protein
MQGKRNRRTTLATVVASAAGFFIYLALLAAPVFGQSLTGRWAATGKTLDNGEPEKAILELTQTGSDLHG